MVIGKLFEQLGKILGSPSIYIMWPQLLNSLSLCKPSGEGLHVAHRYVCSNEMKQNQINLTPGNDASDSQLSSSPPNNISLNGNMSEYLTVV